MGTRVPRTEPGYQESGRTRQKARTRAALIEAARELLTDGSGLTVEAAAERAGISRTTAYRYFRNHRELLAATYPEIEEPSLLGKGAATDPAERLDAVIASVLGQLRDHEPELRAQLRLSLDPGEGEDDLPLRQGRVLRWIEDALEPLREQIGKRGVHRLALAIRATLGIEPLVWLTDVGGASREEAFEIMGASARTLYEAALDDDSER